MTALEILTLAGWIVIAWVALIGLFLMAWIRFADRRAKLTDSVTSDRQRRLDNDLTDLTHRPLTDAERAAFADVQAHWATTDREDRS